jgi:hypothetical protein
MKYIRIFADKDGETHMEDCTLAYRSDVIAKDVPSLHMSSLLKAEGVFFMHAVVDKTFRDLPFHNPLRRMLVIRLRGSSEQTTSDGTVRIVNPWDVLSAEDVTG